MTSSQVFLATNKQKGVSFHYTYPAKTGLSLRSVVIEDGGLPKLLFDAAHSRQLPTLTEEDVATVARVVSEGKRPEFFYTGFENPSHPFFHSGRLYKQYRPAYLRGTSVGDLVSEADWSMKCLHVGTRSNESKTEFWSWPKTSKLQNLATHMDFPYDEKKRGCVLMSCDHITMEESENEILFTEEPKMRITDRSKPMYSKYITEYYDRVAYHDEPLFMKMQELMKLIAAMEWMKGKGIVFNEKWLKFHTEKYPVHQQAVTTNLDNKTVKALLDTMSLTPSLKAHSDGSYGPVSMKLEEGERTKSGVEFIGTRYCPIISLEEITTFRATFDDYGFLYKKMDCQMPFFINEGGEALKPDINSWNELFAETVPVPHRIGELKDDQEPVLSFGGITTRDAPVKVKKVDRVKKSENENVEVKATTKIQPQKYTLQECQRKAYQVPPTDIQAGTLEEHINKTNITDTHHGFHSKDATTIHSPSKGTITNRHTAKVSAFRSIKIDGQQVGQSEYQGTTHFSGIEKAETPQTNKQPATTLLPDSGQPQQLRQLLSPSEVSSDSGITDVSGGSSSRFTFVSPIGSGDEMDED